VTAVVILSFLAIDAPRRSSGPSVKSITSSPGYESYIRGRVKGSSENRVENEEAIALLRQAVAADPELAPAHAELARAYTIRAFYYAPDSQKKQLFDDAAVAVEKALALEPNLAEGYFAKGLMLWTPRNRFPHEQAIIAYQRALSLGPRLDEAHHQLALVLLHVGLFDAAWAHIDTSLAINPANTLARFRYGVISMYRGDYEQANLHFHRTPLDHNPSLWAFQQATALFRLGRSAEAIALIE
jgi:tetratricopeptide (TPR) repeat protein